MPNPIAHEKIAKIALEPLKIENVETNLLGKNKVETSGTLEGIVFWTKNPKPMLEKLDRLKDYKYYFLYTLNAYPKEIEANLPPLEEKIAKLEKQLKSQQEDEEYQEWLKEKEMRKKNRQKDFEM